MTLSNIGSSKNPSKRRPGRPPALGADAIAAAVLTVGFRELTFAEVADQLGVAQATLYRHAANRDELVRLGLDLAVRRTTWPDLDGPWHKLLERWALATWHAWAMSPGAVAEATRGIVPASVVELTDRVGVALVERGFTPRHAVLAVDLVFDLAADSRRGVEALEVTLESQSTSMRKAIELEWANRHDASEIASQLRNEMVRAIKEDPLAWFTSKLRIVLAGIKQELAPHGIEISAHAPRQQHAPEAPQTPEALGAHSGKNAEKESE